MASTLYLWLTIFKLSWAIGDIFLLKVGNTSLPRLLFDVNEFEQAGSVIMRKNLCKKHMYNVHLHHQPRYTHHAFINMWFIKNYWVRVKSQPVVSFSLCQRRSDYTFNSEFNNIKTTVYMPIVVRLQHDSWLLGLLQDLRRKNSPPPPCILSHEARFSWISV